MGGVKYGKKIKISINKNEKFRRDKYKPNKKI